VEDLDGVKVIRIAVGHYHSLALDEDGIVWAWGQNWYGQLGDGTKTDRVLPKELTGLVGVSALSGGHNHSLALGEDGTVRAWGSNQYGQLGYGTSERCSVGDVDVPCSSTPQPVTMSDVVAVDAGGQHSMALREGGEVWAWGFNGNGQLGNGTYVDQTAPVSITLPLDLASNGVESISAGALHTLAVDNDGQAWAWGNGGDGSLGGGDYNWSSIPKPVSVSTGMGFVSAVAAGTDHSLARCDDGTVWAWGTSTFGARGDGTSTTSNTPQLVDALSRVDGVDAGSRFSLALSDGKVWAWGQNLVGQLGDGTNTTCVAGNSCSLSPQQVEEEETLLEGVISVAAGENFSLALKADGTVWAWGHGGYGNLGNGSSFNQAYAAPVDLYNSTSYAVAISAGAYHSLALMADGTVLGWGRNDFGQLGSDPRVVTNVDPPTRLEGLIMERNASVGTSQGLLAGGGNHSLVILPDGGVKALGGNHYGQLGIGVDTWSPQPVVWEADAE